MNLYSRSLTYCSDPFSFRREFGVGQVTLFKEKAKPKKLLKNPEALNDIMFEDSFRV